MNILDRATDKAYPKVQPLAQALLSAAIEQGATVRDFELACQRVLEEAKGKFLHSRLADFKGNI